MNQQKRLKITFRVGVVATGLTALFWGAWYLIAGSVPHVPFLFHLLDGNGTGFAVSRFWDIAAAPLWTYLVTRIVGTAGVLDELDELLSEDWIDGLGTLLAAVFIVAFIVVSFGVAFGDIKAHSYFLLLTAVSILLSVLTAAGATAHFLHGGELQFKTLLAVGLAPGAASGAITGILFGVANGGFCFAASAAVAVILVGIPTFTVKAATRTIGWVREAFETDD